MAVLSTMLVPPTAVSHGDEAGKLTASWGSGSASWELESTQSAEPSSPLAASMLIPLAAASSSAASTSPMPARPMASRTCGSHRPREAEITSGL